MKLDDLSYEWEAGREDPIHIRAIYWILEATRKTMNRLFRPIE